MSSPLAQEPQPHCLFCKIVRGEIPSALVFENDIAVAFLDIRPVNKGHVLLVPRAHHNALTELDETIAAATAVLLPKLCRAVTLVTKAEGVNVIINNGEVAGQTIMHGHWHIIPRWKDDPVHWPWPHQEYRDDELKEMRAAIVSKLNPAPRGR